MTRVPAVFAVGLLAAGAAVGQAPVAPMPTRLPPGAGVPRPFVTPPIGFAGGFHTPGSGYVLPAFGGYYTSPSLFPFTNGFYPNYAIMPPGFYGGVGTIVNVTNNAGGSPVRTVNSQQFAPNVSGEEKATLTIALPAAGDVWLGGVRQKDAGNTSTYVLTSPVLKPGEQHKFEIRAEWLVDGKRYRSERTVSVSAGDNQKLTMVLGDLVK